ncbi:hypothetical protein B5X24_HaOG213493, partial [Helicoverpa armigera]
MESVKQLIRGELRRGACVHRHVGSESARQGRGKREEDVHSSAHPGVKTKLPQGVNPGATGRGVAVHRVIL